MAWASRAPAAAVSARLPGIGRRARDEAEQRDACRRTVTDAARAATSGHMPASSPVWDSATKKQPEAEAGAERVGDAAQVGRAQAAAALGGHQHDRHEREGHADDRGAAGALALDVAGDHRDGGGEQRGDRGDHAHLADRQALVEQADAGGAAQPAERADHEVAAVGLAGRRTASTRAAAARPSRCDQSSTVVAGIRRAARPPQKSPMP